MTMTEVKVGQIYASTHRADAAARWRQRRRVVKVSPDFVWLRTLAAPLGSSSLSTPSRIRLRDTATGKVIPGHRLVEDVEASA